jgi:hypothetical protein
LLGLKSLAGRGGGVDSWAVAETATARHVANRTLDFVDIPPPLAPTITPTELTSEQVSRRKVANLWQGNNIERRRSAVWPAISEAQ